MRTHRAVLEVPLWMRDACVRQKMTDSIRRRRARRKSELAKLEQALRLAGQTQLSSHTGVK